MKGDILDGKRYNTLNSELKRVFGEKVMKLSLDGGFTCPNRDGTIGNRGCIFCSEEGSGEFAGPRDVSIKEQISQQIELLSKKWKANSYIAYFQNFTNTYGPIDYLENLYEEALSADGVVGLAIATRPDCLSEDVIDLLDRLNKRTFLWVELGLQSIHEASARFVRRGYSLLTYSRAVERLKERGIRVVTHLIIGLPNEDKNDMMASIRYVASKNIWGIKLHSLYIQRETDLYEYYNKSPFKLLTKEEYVEIIADALEILPPALVIHRLTGDGKKELLHEPKWSADKASVLTSIDKELKIRDSYQGVKSI